MNDFLTNHNSFSNLSFRASLSRLFNRTPSPNRRSLKSCDRSPSPKSRNRLSPLFSRNSAPPSSTESSQPSINKSICSPSSSPKLFDKSERTFNIPASLVFQNNEISSVSKSDKKLENNEINDILQDSKSIDNNLDKSEHSKIAKSLSSSPTPAAKPPIPAPRAINNQDKPKSIGKYLSI